MRRGVLVCVVAVLIPVVLAAGCKGPQLIGTKQEIQIGQDVAEQMRREHGVDRDPGKAARVEAIGRRLVSVADRKELPWSFEVLATDEINAFAVMGGSVFVTNGILHMIGRDDGQLACVLGHEVAHVTRRHGVKQLQKALGFEIIVGLLTKGDTQKVASVAANLIQQGYSRDDEKEADLTGLEYALNAGFDGWGMVRFFERLEQMEGSGSTPEFLSSHPKTDKRIERVTQRLEERHIPRP